MFIPLLQHSFNQIHTKEKNINFVIENLVFFLFLSDFFYYYNIFYGFSIY